jgi:hypothetical protein
MDVTDIINLYNDSVYDNLKMINNILISDIGLNDPYLMDLFNKELQSSKNGLIEKWKSGKKYLRTLSVVKAFPEYPMNSLNLSISIDAMINIFDDLFDENLEKHIKNYYLLELFRMLANYHYQASNENLRFHMGNYFNKLIMIASLEKHFYNLIKNEKRDDNLLKTATHIYDIRSLDVDVFIEITLLASDTIQFKDDVLKVARIYRALELLKKDILDIEHDIENGLETLFTIFWDRKNYLKNLISKLTNLYLERAKNIMCSEYSEIIVNNFILMSENEANKINEYIKFLS